MLHLRGYNYCQDVQTIVKYALLYRIITQRLFAKVLMHLMTIGRPKIISMCIYMAKNNMYIYILRRTNVPLIFGLLFGLWMTVRFVLLLVICYFQSLSQCFGLFSFILGCVVLLSATQWSKVTMNFRYDHHQR